MTWYDRRAILLTMAQTEPGWGCVKLVDERHIGRVVITRTRGWKHGLYRTSDAQYAALNHFYAAKQRALTKSLPK